VAPAPGDCAGRSRLVLEGTTVGLRAETRADRAALYAVDQLDPEHHAMIDAGPWTAPTLETALAAYDRQVADPSGKSVGFAVQRLGDETGACIGSATLWDIDTHQRTAHIGIGLLPDARGKGVGREVLDLMCRYAFTVRDLHRVQLETLATNVAMQRAALAAGFAEEGRLRESAYVMGERVDDVLFGILRREWRSRG
jgi:RimJ/RimL family protein N-acetyltransferase